MTRLSGKNPGTDMKPGCPGPGENPGSRVRVKTRVCTQPTAPGFSRKAWSPLIPGFSRPQSLSPPRAATRFGQLDSSIYRRTGLRSRRARGIAFALAVCAVYAIRTENAACMLASIVCVLAGAAGWWLAAGLVAGCGVGLWCWLVGLARPGRQPAVRGGRKGMSETGALRFWLGSGWTQARSPSLPGCLV